MTRKTILVCGGSGYIGSHMCKMLAQHGHLPITFDNLSTGHRWAVKWGPFLEGDLLEPATISDVFHKYEVDAVMHFAGLSQVAESVANPGSYFRNNVTGTLNLIDAMLAAEVSKLIFSSTAAVYGDPQYTPIDESHQTQPINPYGWSKLFAERQIAEYCRAHGLRAACLRYFNAAGADPDGEIGEVHDPETHLIPNLLHAALDASREPVKLFGNDYPTPDGTCIRDFLHVMDLCRAHLCALEFLERLDGAHVFNLGSGTGHSVSDVLTACRAAADGRLQAETAPRRPGDPSVLVACNKKAVSELSWSPIHSLQDIVDHALAWHKASTQLTQLHSRRGKGSLHEPSA